MDSGSYTDYDTLVHRHPSLASFYVNGTYNFSRQGQCALTKALFKEWCGVEIVVLEGHLIPAMPSRRAYLAIVERVLKECGIQGKKGIDVGTGAYAVYAIIGAKVFGWEMIGVDVDVESVNHARAIIEANGVKGVSIVQGDGLVEETDVDFTVCNPPFYLSEDDMKKKGENKEELKRDPVVGTTTELVYEGGEVAFVMNLIEQSKKREKSQTWYSSMLGMKSSIQELIAQLTDSHIVNFHVQTYQLGATRRWILFWSHGCHHPLVYHHQVFKNVPITVEEGKFDLDRVEEVLRDMPIEIEAMKEGEEVYELTVKVPGVVWSRAYRRHPERMDKSPHTFVISREQIHFIFGESFRTFQSFYTYLLSRLKNA